MKTTIQALKKRTLLCTTIFAFGILTIFTSCSKEGPADPAGQDGNPVVLYSDWLPTGTLSDGTVDGNTGSQFVLAEPKITQEILDKGVILTYLRISAAGDFSSLQLPYHTIAGGGANTIAYYPSVGQIKIMRFKNDGINGTTFLGTGWKWRYIIIPGGTKVNGKMSNDPENLKEFYQKMSYEEVCNYLNIAP